MVITVSDGTEDVLKEIGALDVPAGMKIVAGTCAAGWLLERATVAPPVGAVSYTHLDVYKRQRQS